MEFGRAEHQYSISCLFSLSQDWGNTAHRGSRPDGYTLEHALYLFGVLLISFPRSYPSAFLD